MLSAACAGLGGSCEAHWPTPEASQLLVGGGWRHRATSRVCLGKAEEEDHERRIGRRRRAGRGGFATAAAAAAARGGGFSASHASRPALDSQAFQSLDSPQMLWIGPVPGDVAEVEAYCRIFRAAEQLHNVIMKTVCNPETGECTVSYDIPMEMLPQLEEKVVSMLGCMLALLDRGREEVLSGRSCLAQSFQAEDISVSDGRLPPLAVFRGEVKRCCENLLVALAKYPTTDERSANIWRKLQRLRNACYDAGFPRGEGQPCPTMFANWGLVCFTTKKEELTCEDCEAAFWKGGQVTDEGLAWLVEKGYKTIVDLRKEVAEDKYYQGVLKHASSCGQIEVIKLPVEVGMAPSRVQVDLFASLVSDPSKRPLYLHSQEGVYRTSAMVSRWRQHIARSAAQPTSKAIATFNGVSGKVSNSSNQSEIEDHGTSRNGNGAIHSESHSPHEELEADVTHDFTGGTYKNGDLASQDANQKKKVSSLMNDGVEEDSGLRSHKEINPLRVQFPTGNIFSRKEMIRFFNKKSAPQTYLDLHKKACRSRFTPTERKKTSKTTKPAMRDETLTSRDSFQNGDNNNHKGQLNDASDHSFDSSLNGNGAKPSYARNMNKETNTQALPTMTERAPDKNVNGYIAPANNDVEVVETNMCASTTGVVRVQSRKKAEMFLVRTDGVTCTREQVTESSLAFTHPTTQQQMLLWKSTPKTVLLLKKLGKELLEETKQVASFLHHQEEMNVLVEPDVHDMLARTPGFGFVQTFYSQDTSYLHERVDFVACLGGDGVILHASNIFRGAVPPVVSFNLGSLGFLTSHSFDDSRQDLSAVIHGNNTLDGVYITLRMRLHCEIFRNGKLIPGKVFEVLNEVVVDRGSNPYISKIECYEHNRLITKVQGDGVIIATPTGSTAYSTAAGGSVVHPNVPCMLFTPICPHSLSFRPVILPDSAQLELKIPEEARSNAWVSFDGKRRQQLSRGDSVRISMSEHPLPTVNKSDQTGDWFRSLIRCLNWNERLEQQPL